MNNRLLPLAGVLTSTTPLLAALYFQHADGLAPCPLCILQRLAFLAAGVVFIIALAHNPHRRTRQVYGFTATLAAAAGAAVAARHLWLQNLPASQVPECGPGLQFLLEAFPLRRALDLILRGSGECAEVQWTLLGLSMPGWSLLSLLAVAGLGVWYGLRRE